MPYIGRELDSGNYLKLDDISSSFNGSTTTFNLTAAGKAFFPGSAFSILVNLAGVVQEPESAYQINNATITFATAPVAGDQFFCIVLGVAHGINVPGNGTVNGAQLAKPFNYDGYFYLDDANNRVGVGTVTPQKPLHVVGEGQFDSVRILGDLTIDGTTTTLDTVVTEVDKLEVGANNSTVGVAITQSGSGDILNLYDGASSVFSVADGGTVTASGDISIADKIIHTGDTNTAIRFPAADTFSVETGGSERLRITSAGKIGIGGETSPEFKVTIYDAGYSGVTIKSNRTTATDNIGGLHFKTQSTNVAYIQSLVDGTIKFRNTSSLTERLRITSAGSVGIGTNSPQSQFEVFGSSPVVRSKNTTNQTYTEISNDGTDGYLDWSSGGLIFRGASNTERLRIASDGKVGIGLTNPTNTLEISKVNNHGITLTRPAGGSNPGTVKFEVHSNGAGRLISERDFNLNFDTDNIGNQNFGVSANGTERLRITSAGNVGIGTDNPGDKLSIYTAPNALVFGAKDTTRGNHIFQLLANNPAGDGELRLYKSSATGTHEKTVEIKSTGNSYFTGGSVGIGTNNPALRAHIFSTANADAALIESTQNFATLRFKSATNTSGPTIGIDGAGGLQIDQKDTSKYIAFAVGTERLRIASDGVITINTVPATNNNANQAVLFQTAAGAIHGGSGLLYNPAEDTLKVNGNIISSNSFFGAGAGPLMLAVANYSSTQYIKVSNKIEIKGNVGINEANPSVSLDLASNTDAVSLPTGTTAQRPSGTDAYIRKNSTNNALEFYNGANWVEIITDYFPTGSTTLGWGKK